MGFLIALIVGGLAGMFAAMIVKGSGLGVIGNIIVGFFGAVLANLVGGNAQLSNPTWMGFFEAILGAVVLLFIVSLLTRNRSL